MVSPDMCSCCGEIWNRENLKRVPVGEHSLRLCPECYSELMKPLNTAKAEVEELAKRSKDLEQQSCGDCISRQYLLDNCVVDKVTMPYVPISKIKNAPPVVPQQKTGRWTNGNPICPCCGEDKFKDSDADNTYQ